MTSEAVDYLPGDVVKTSFGVGVIVRGIGRSSTTPADEPPPDHASSSPFPSYKVLLWRIPGKSVGSSSTAYLQPSAVRYDTYAVLSKPTDQASHQTILDTLLFSSSLRFWADSQLPQE